MATNIRVLRPRSAAHRTAACHPMAGAHDPKPVPHLRAPSHTNSRHHPAQVPPCHHLVVQTHQTTSTLHNTCTPSTPISVHTASLRPGPHTRSYTRAAAAAHRAQATLPVTSRRNAPTERSQ